MNSNIDNEALSDDLRHEIAKHPDVFYEENEYRCQEECEDEQIEGDSYVEEVHGYSRGSLFDLIYVGKEEQEDEAEEEQEEDTFSAVGYDETRFRYGALSDEERQEIVRKVRDLSSEVKVSMIVNKFLHKNYIDTNRKSPSMANALDKFDETLIFEDTRYQATLENFAQTRDDVDERIASLATELENLENSCSSAESAYAEMFENLLSQQLALAKKTKPPKYSKESWLSEVEHYLENQRQRALEVERIRLARVHLQGKLAKLTGRLKQFDSLGPGFSMMDYEYLLKRKDVYSERRDEQRQNIRKLNDKNLSSAAIIRHIDEEADLYNEKVTTNLNRLNVLVKGNKYERYKSVELAKTKVSISKSTNRLREQIGLLNYPFLLGKMERDLREITTFEKRTDTLQTKMIRDAKIISECRT